MCYRFFVDGEEITAEKAAEIECSKRHGWDENVFVEKLSSECLLENANDISGEWMDDSVYLLRAGAFVDDNGYRIYVYAEHDIEKGTYTFFLLHDDEQVDIPELIYGKDEEASRYISDRLIEQIKAKINELIAAE